MTVHKEAVELATTALLLAIGEDPKRPGLVGTPARVARYWAEFLDTDQGSLERVFAQDGYDEMVVLRGIRYHSLCEHHLLPFFGTAAVAYIPNGKGVLGLSKLARIVRKYASRLQLQERLTAQVADEIQRLTGAKGVGVSVSGLHLCAAMRGVRAQDTQFVTNVLRGAMLENPAARAEFLDAARAVGP